MAVAQLALTPINEARYDETIDTILVDVCMRQTTDAVVDLAALTSGCIVSSAVEARLTTCLSWSRRPRYITR